MKPMLILNGLVQNVYITPSGKSRETGEEYGGRFYIQLLAENPLRNVETRIELVNLGCEDRERFLKLKGKEVSLPVGEYVTHGRLVRYLLEKHYHEDESAPGQESAGCSNTAL